MKEKDMEDILAKYPELLEPGLKLIGRQVTIHGRRMDLCFSDANGRTLIVELKAGPILDQHIGQIMFYEGSVLSEKNSDIRAMLVGTRVPPSIQRALDHHGIAWKELRFSDFTEFLQERRDHSFQQLFEEDKRLNQYFEGDVTPKVDSVDVTEFPSLVQKIIDIVIKPLSNDISMNIGKRYSSYFLHGGRFMHFYDRKPTRIQVHVDKRYLVNIGKAFDMQKVSEKFEVNETGDDYVVKIRDEMHLPYLAQYFRELYCTK